MDRRDLWIFDSIGIQVQSFIIDRLSMKIKINNCAMNPFLTSEIDTVIQNQVHLIYFYTCNGAEALLMHLYRWKCGFHAQFTFKACIFPVEWRSSDNRSKNFPSIALCWCTVYIYNYYLASFDVQWVCFRMLQFWFDSILKGDLPKVNLQFEFLMSKHEQHEQFQK